MEGGTLLDAISHGKVTISVDGKPLMALDTDSKSLDVEMAGLERLGLRISDLFLAGYRGKRVYLKSSGIVRKFVKNGWRFSLYDKGDRLVMAGGTSRFGPILRFNPLRLRRILRAA
ncbi:MAG TPA: hypothetical protein VJ792_09205 [Candidatus Nitrosotalea sp.]|nr:hypothetical protein [Candidatus Nitrosotalea sp.]